MSSFSYNFTELTTEKIHKGRTEAKMTEVDVRLKQYFSFYFGQVNGDGVFNVSLVFKYAAKTSSLRITFRGDVQLKKR